MGAGQVGQTARRVDPPPSPSHTAIWPPLSRPFLGPWGGRPRWKLDPMKQHRGPSQRGPGVARHRSRQCSWLVRRKLSQERGGSLSLCHTASRLGVASSSVAVGTPQTASPHHTLCPPSPSLVSAPVGEKATGRKQTMGHHFPEDIAGIMAPPRPPPWGSLPPLQGNSPAQTGPGSQPHGPTVPQRRADPWSRAGTFPA